MDSTPVYNIETLIIGYNRKHFKALIIYADIIQWERCYLCGYEGIPYSDQLGEDNDAPIAEAHIVKCPPIKEFDAVIMVIPPKYYAACNPLPARKEFCVEMKQNYNVTIGTGKKAYQYICKVRALPVEGIESNTSIGGTKKCGQYQYIQPSQHDSEQKDVEAKENINEEMEEIELSDNVPNDVDTKENVPSQQEPVVKNTNKCKYSNNQKISLQHPSITTKKSILGNTNRNKYTQNQEIEEYEDRADPLGQIAAKKYEVLPLKTNAIGTMRDVYIDHEFIKLWINYLFPCFYNESMMHCWLDYMTAIQMIQGRAKQYICNKNKIFMCGIINYELRDNYNNILYGIICPERKNKYLYKLTTLMTKEQIDIEFGINGYDIPIKARKQCDFISKLVLKRKILQYDLNQIRWGNIKMIKSQLNNNPLPYKSVTIRSDIMQYINISIERANNSYDLIPIMVTEQNNYYDVEWVLIVHIIHRNYYVGVSFKYSISNNLFIATSIYLNKADVESKHKLLGLKYDFCQNIPSFAC